MRTTTVVALSTIVCTIFFSHGEESSKAVVGQNQQNESVTSKLEVARSAIALNIKDNEPEDPAETFPTEVKRLFCFTHIKGASDSAEIQHRWYWNDGLLTTISLSVKSASWRTHSAKTIPVGMTGEWRVAVVDATNDQLLKMLKFTVE